MVPTRVLTTLGLMSIVMLRISPPSPHTTNKYIKISQMNIIVCSLVEKDKIQQYTVQLFIRLS